MKPGANPELERYFSREIIDRIVEDAELQDDIGPIFAELSTKFDAVTRIGTVADNNLATFLMAMGALGREDIAVYGFRPMEFMDALGMMTAQVAPSHDSSEVGTQIVNSRVFRLCLDPNDHRVSEANGIELYGLNLFTDTRTEKEAAFSRLASTSPLLVVSSTAKVIQDNGPVTGRTNIVAVRNQKSGVVKVYGFSVVDQNEMGSASAPIERGAGGREITLSTSDYRRITLTLLSGTALTEATREFEACLGVLSNDQDTGLLSESELTAIRRSIDPS